MKSQRCQRYIAKCSCGVFTSTLAVNVGQANADMGALFEDTKGETGVYGSLAVRCRECGTARRAKAVLGRYSAKKMCNTKCHASTGPLCECSCGGRNHGAAYTAADEVAS